MNSPPGEDQALADQIIEKAILFCADKKFAGMVPDTREALRRGRCDACEYISYSIVKQVGEYLGSMDRTVKAVYAFKPDKAPLTQQSSNVTAGRRASGINLVAWVNRKSPALAALGATLGIAISASRREIGCVNSTPACCHFTMHLVDDEEVLTGRGYGAIVQSTYVRSLQVWTRVEQMAGAVQLVTEPVALSPDQLVSFNPEIAPEEVLFEQALAMERMPPEMRASLEHRLQEAKVVLIRRIISDQLAYINIAREWFSVADLVEIRKRKIGYGKIGGKAAGLLLAARILEKTADEGLRTHLKVPESYFIGSDVVYVFMSANGLTHHNDTKYLPEDQIRAAYPRIQQEFQRGEFPPDILEKLGEMLDEIGRQPIIVRSSSQLEDNFGTSFAGKYDSVFCPNMGSRAENLRALTKAIAHTFASMLKPDALLYRRSRGLQDYDERMAILVQVVQGERWGKYFLPHGAGVAFSRNLYRWAPQIRREDGFARIVWGLGTRAVERVGNDYPRLVALSHPNLQPDDSTEAIRHYSQKFVDLIDLECNEMKTLPVGEVITPAYAPLRYLVQVEQDGYFSPLRARLREADVPRVAVNFSEFLKRTPFASRLSQILKLLEANIHSAVDMEFTFQVEDLLAPRPEVRISLLQCRPQAHFEAAAERLHVPRDLREDQVILSTRFMVPQGHAGGIRYVVYVSPEGYFRLGTAAERLEVGRLVGKLNGLLPAKKFICVGPGRWGTQNPDLGVYVLYGDVFNAAALVELAGEGVGVAPEASLGTHFFQDLMEAEIYPLALLLDKPGTVFNRKFFDEAASCTGAFMALDGKYAGVLRVIDVEQYASGKRLEIVMDDEVNEAVGYLADKS